MRLVQAGYPGSEVARMLNLPLQTVHNWINAERGGKLFSVKLDSAEIAFLLRCCREGLNELNAIGRHAQSDAQAQRDMLAGLRTKLEAGGGWRELPAAPKPARRTRPVPHPDALNRLLDTVKQMRNLKTDRELATLLDMGFTTLSRMRHAGAGRSEIGETTLLRLHEATGWSIRKLKQALRVAPSEAAHEPLRNKRSR